jgi:hypothetical protein
MPENDFLAFAGDPAANVMTQADYLVSSFTARILGFSTGTAYSIQCNKVWRQSSLISAMIAQFTCDQTGADMLDNGSAAIPTLETNFTNAIKAVAVGVIGVGYLPLTGGALSGGLTINSANALNIAPPASTDAIALFNRNAGNSNLIRGQTSDVERWRVFLCDPSAETGNQAGSNLLVQRFTDAGVLIDTPFSINRQTGVVNFTAPPTLAGSLLPYLPITGGTTTGAVVIGGNGIGYAVAPEGPAHRVGFGWNGSAAELMIDGTSQGLLATEAYVGGVAGNYLPIAGGTVTGGLQVNSGVTFYGGGGFQGSCYFAARGDFVNFWSGGYRFRQWAGSWFDCWNESSGERVWASPSQWIMTLDGSGNLSVTNTVRVNGARTLTIGNANDPCCAVWNTPYGAGGFWYDPSGMWWGWTDGNANPTSGRTLIGTDGHFENWGSGVFHGSMQVDSNLNAGGTINAGGNVQAGNGNIYLNSNGMIYYPTIGGDGWNWRWDGRWMYNRVDNAVEWGMCFSVDLRCYRFLMSGSTLCFLDSDNSTWYLNTYRSDAAFKQNIRTAPEFDSLTAIMALPIRSYDRTDCYDLSDPDADDSHVPYGVIGQEIDELLPGTVDWRRVWDDQPDRPKGAHLNLAAMVVHAYRAIQQLQAEIEELKHVRH